MVTHEALVFQFLKENCSQNLLDKFCKKSNFNEVQENEIYENIGLEEIVRLFYERNIFVKAEYNNPYKICECHGFQIGKCPENIKFDFKIISKDDENKWYFLHCSRKALISKSRVFRAMFSHEEVKETLKGMIFSLIRIFHT